MDDFFPLVLVRYRVNLSDGRGSWLAVREHGPGWGNRYHLSYGEGFRQRDALLFDELVVKPPSEPFERDGARDTKYDDGAVVGGFDGECAVRGREGAHGGSRCDRSCE